MKSISRVKSLANKPGFRYLFVGGTAYVVEMAALYGITLIGTSDVLAVALSFWVGLTFSFFAQKLIAFRNRDRNSKAMSKQLGGYLILVAFNYVFTLAFVGAFAAYASVFVLRTLSIGIITLWNFFIYRQLFKVTA